jgi:hypothetical protein
VAEVAYRTADLALYRALRVLDGADPLSPDADAGTFELALHSARGDVTLTSRAAPGRLHERFDSTSSTVAHGHAIRHLPIPALRDGGPSAIPLAARDAFRDVLLSYYRAKPELRTVFPDPESIEFWRWANVEAFDAYPDFRCHLPPVPPPELRDVVSNGGLVGFLDAGFASFLALQRVLAALLPRHDRDQLEILPANSSNAFGTRVLTTLSPQLSAFAYGDLNGDGLGDVVWTNPLRSSVRVRLAQPGGSFGAEVIYRMANFPVGGQVRLARINADAHLDAMVVAGSMRAVLFGNGSGGFGTPIIRNWLTGVNQLEVDDFDGDGLADVAVSQWYLNSAGYSVESSSIHVGDGLGEFTFAVSSLSQSLAMTTGDFDGDGIDDVVRSEGFSAHIWRVNGAGGFVESSLPAGSYLALVALDLDLDGKLDLAGASAYGGLDVLLGNGAGQLSAPQLLHFVVGERLAAVDFDGDGRTDLVVEGEGSLLSLRNNGGGTVLELGRVHAASSSSRGLKSGDVTGDGRPDLLCGVEFPSGVMVIPNLGAASGPVVFCTAKTTSNGCVPQIGLSGAPSASATSGFVLQCSDTINNKQGLLVYSLTGQSSVPFQGGVLCLRAPTLRTPVINSLGNPGPDDCSGVFSRDFSAFAHGAGGGTPAPALRSRRSGGAATRSRASPAHRVSRTRSISCSGPKVLRAATESRDDFASLRKGSRRGGVGRRNAGVLARTDRAARPLAMASAHRSCRWPSSRDFLRESGTTLRAGAS